MLALAPITTASGEIRTAWSNTPAVVLAAVNATLAGEMLRGDDEARTRALSLK